MLDDPALEEIRRGFDRTSAGIVTIESRERELPALDRDFDSELAAVRPGWFQPVLKIKLFRARREVSKLSASKERFAAERAALINSMQELVELLNKGSVQ